MIGSAAYRWYKIGKSSTPLLRVKNLGVLLPFKIQIMAVWKSSDMDALESWFHAKYQNAQINGEWFKLNNDKVLEIVYGEHSDEVGSRCERIYAFGDGSDHTFASFSNSGHGKSFMTDEERMRCRIESIERRASRERCPSCGRAIPHGYEEKFGLDKHMH